MAKRYLPMLAWIFCVYGMNAPDEGPPLEQEPEQQEEIGEVEAEVVPAAPRTIADFIMHARHGMVDEMKRDIESGIDVNAQDDNTDCALTIAACNGHEEAFAYLLTIKEINVNLSDQFQWNALHYAVWHGYPIIVAQLIEAGINVNARVSASIDPNRINIDSGCTALHYAVQEGHVDIVRLLLRAQAIEVDPVNEQGLTPLHYAVFAENPNETIVRMILQAGAFYERIYFQAKELGLMNMCELIDGKSRFDRDKKAMIQAILQGQYGLTKYYMIKVQLDWVDERGDNALHYAVRSGSVDLFRLILGYNPKLLFKPNKKGYTPYGYCFYYECRVFLLNEVTHALVPQNAQDVTHEIKRD